MRGDVVWGGDLRGSGTGSGEEEESDSRGERRPVERRAGRPIRNIYHYNLPLNVISKPLLRVNIPDV